MTDKEILAGLKSSYEKLYDIRENGCSDHCIGQLSGDLIKLLENAKYNIEVIYSEFYKSLDKETLRVKALEKDDNKVYIASDVSFDYESNSHTLSCEDTGYYWYENKEFLDDKEYTIEIWETEWHRDAGESFIYNGVFDNYDEALETARKLFEDNNYASIEILDNNDNALYCRDNESEDFYFGEERISYVDEDIAREYILNYTNKIDQTFSNNKLYYNNGDVYIAIDNSSGNCWTEEFKTEKEAQDWLFKDKLEKNNDKDFGGNII